MGRYFPEYVLPAEIALSVVCQLAIKDITNPFGLVLVDVPSSGKTITLNFLRGLKELVYVTDDFSPASFVSNAANRKKEELDEIDLLPKIKDKVLLVRDLTPIFGKRDDDLLKMLGILTRVFDGEGLLINTGLHGQRGYEGKYRFMFLAGCTPFQHRVWKIMGNFGSRLFFLNLNTPDKDHIQLANQLRAKLSPKRKERKCREATCSLIDEVFEGIRAVSWDKEQDQQNHLEEIAIMAKLVAGLRGTINVWQEEGRDGFNYTAPQIEKPDRINQLFYNLARGHAVLCSRTKLEDEDIAVVLRVALSSAPMERVKFFKLLISNNGVLEVEDVVNELGFSYKTALRLVKVFEHLGIVQDSLITKGYHVDEDTPRKAGRSVELLPCFSWFVGKRFKELKTLFSGTGSN